MFRRKKRPSIEVTKLQSLVAGNVTVRGDIEFDGGLRVDGRVEGNVVSADGARSLLVLSDKGTIAGRVKVHDAVINGRVEGDLEVEHFLELQAGAQVCGNIVYRQLQMDCGATVDGKLERREPATTDDGKVVALIAAPKPVSLGQAGSS
ncbi:MAG: polymer-forming cytoskeletal protein [Gammaproteobacteria bacterium]|nr:polymer-forming cytoskeletal protein [Gammaproteobacteria bacterium]